MLYYYGIGEEQCGPIEENDLLQLYSNQTITMDTLIWAETFQDWIALKESEIGIMMQKLSPSQISAISSSMSMPKDPFSRRNEVKTSSFDETSSSETESSSLAGLDAKELWIEDDKLVWVKGKIVNYNFGDYTLQHSITGVIVEVRTQHGHLNVYKVNPTSSPDVTSLSFIHEPAILDNLYVRYKEKRPYTFMGSVLIAVNPLERLEEPDTMAYNQDLKKIPATSSASSSASVPNQPHPYALAETAYQQLNFSKHNQSVVISGESGSGKTETAKILLRYLVNRSSNDSIDHSHGLDARLLESSPILESFGNAKTGKNNNSSRFGKFMKLLYHPPSSSSSSSYKQLSLAGAVVETYLLEKSRVVHQAKGERNYHIFYRLLLGIQHHRRILSSRFLSIIDEVNLIHADDFHLLNQSGCIIIDEHHKNDEDDYFVHIFEAFHTVGFNQEEIDDILLLLYAILLLGNITYDGMDGIEGTCSVIKDMTICHHIASIFDVDDDKIRSLLTERKVCTRGEWFTKQLTIIDAIYTRDAIAKSLYESLFLYIVDGINRNLAILPSSSSSSSSSTLKRSASLSSSLSALSALSDHWIGVLDIFGFENFHENQYEQLLINFANETIQHTFNHQVFESELKLYQQENLDFIISSAIPDNTGCVELIGDKSNSILYLLDALSRQPRSSSSSSSVDERFCEELHRLYGSSSSSSSSKKHHPYFLPVHPKDKRHTFMIRHYAGGVRYSITLPSSSSPKSSSSSSSSSDTTIFDETSWISKNIDSYPDDLASVCQEAGMKILTSLDLFSSQDLALTSQPSLSISSYHDMTRQQSLSTSSMSSSYTTSSSPSSSSGRNSPATPRRRTNTVNKPTISSLFNKSMRDLNLLLSSTSCQFVRCIKPSRYMMAGDYDHRYVVEQLRSLGVLQTCEVLKAGYPTRVSYADMKASLAHVIEPIQHLFKKDHNKDDDHHIDDENDHKDDNKYNEQVLISCLLRAYGIDDDIYKLGRTMIFFKADQLSLLSSILHHHHDDNNNDVDNYIISQKIISSLHEVDVAIDATKHLGRELDAIITLIDETRNDAQSLILLYAELESSSSSSSSSVMDDDVFAVPKDIIELIASIDSKVAGIKTATPEIGTIFKQLHHQFKTHKIQSSSSSSVIISEYNALKQRLQLTEKNITNAIRYQPTSSPPSSSSSSVPINQVKKVEEDYIILKRNYILSQTQSSSLSMNSFLSELTSIEHQLSMIDAKYALMKELASQAIDGVHRCKLSYTQAKIIDYQAGMNGFDMMIHDIHDHIITSSKKYASSSTDIIFQQHRELRALGSDLHSRLSMMMTSIDDFKAEADIISKDLISWYDATINRKDDDDDDDVKPDDQVISSNDDDQMISSSVAAAIDGDIEIIKMRQDLLSIRQEIARLRLDAGSKGIIIDHIPSSSSSSPSSVISSNTAKKLLATAKHHRRASTLITNTSSSPSSSSSSSSLPAGWKVLYDKASNRSYYVNLTTNIRQWERPTTDTSSSSDINMMPDDDHDDVRVVERVSKRLHHADVIKALSHNTNIPHNPHHHNINQHAKNMLSSSSSSMTSSSHYATTRASLASMIDRNDKVDHLRQHILMMKYEPSITGQFTVSRLEEIGMMKKTGYLSKQSKVLGRWKKRYCVLDGDSLIYYDSPKEASFQSNGKEFVLEATSAVSYTAKQNSFLLKRHERDDRSEVTPDDWYLQADSESELEEWITAINAHIISKFKRSRHITSDYLQYGDIYPSFWRVPPSSSGINRLPVGIRSLPFLDSPRTLEGIHPGEVIEAIQILENDGNTFLRLADDRGWVYVRHWKVRYDLLQQVDGIYMDNNEEDICVDEIHPSYQGIVFAGPNLNCNVMDVSLAPGSMVRVIAKFITSEDRQNIYCFGKLQKQRGWVVLEHSLQGT